MSSGKTQKIAGRQLQNGDDEHEYHNLDADLLKHEMASSEAIFNVKAANLRPEGFEYSYSHCIGASGRLRVSTVHNVTSTCWYAADWRKMLHLLHKRGYTVDQNMYIHICDSDCNSDPQLGTLAMAKSRRIYPMPKLTDEPLQTRNALEHKTITLLPLNVKRHFGVIEEALRDNVTFTDKKPVAIWRGATTGLSKCWMRGTTLKSEYDEFDFSEYTQGCARWNLVVRWTHSPSSLIDVGISKFVQQVYNVM